MNAPGNARALDSHRTPAKIQLSGAKQKGNLFGDDKHLKGVSTNRTLHLLQKADIFVC